MGRELQREVSVLLFKTKGKGLVGKREEGEREDRRSTYLKRELKDKFRD